jgi:hypothetical protein
MRLFLLLIFAATMLPACASSYASKCIEWQAKESHYELAIGSLRRVDTFSCTAFSEAP